MQQTNNHIQALFLTKKTNFAKSGTRWPNFYKLFTWNLEIKSILFRQVKVNLERLRTPPPPTWKNLGQFIQATFWQFKPNFAAKNFFGDTLFSLEKNNFAKSGTKWLIFLQFLREIWKLNPWYFSKRKANFSSPPPQKEKNSCLLRLWLLWLYRINFKIDNYPFNRSSVRIKRIKGNNIIDFCILLLLFRFVLFFSWLFFRTITT